MCPEQEMLDIAIAIYILGEVQHIDLTSDELSAIQKTKIFLERLLTEIVDLHKNGPPQAPPRPDRAGGHPNT
jgi:hypothetical protein